MLQYLRKTIRENRLLRRQNADLTGLLLETSTALSRAVARNLDLADELRKTTAALRMELNSSYGKRQS